MLASLGTAGNKLLLLLLHDERRRTGTSYKGRLSSEKGSAPVRKTRLCFVTGVLLTLDQHLPPYMTC